MREKIAGFFENGRVGFRTSYCPILEETLEVWINGRKLSNNKYEAYYDVGEIWICLDDLQFGEVIDGKEWRVEVVYSSDFSSFLPEGSFVR